MDISGTIAPDSTQLDAVDLVSGPRTFTVQRVSKGAADQPVNIHLTEFPRPWRPGLSMRRVLVALWGGETDAYTGRRVRLFCDPAVEFGGQAVGGIRISHLSDIDGRKKVPLLVSRGRSAMYTVEPLPDETPTDHVANLRAEWKSADPERRKVIEAEVARLTASDTPDDDYAAAVAAQDAGAGA